MYVHRLAALFVALGPNSLSAPDYGKPQHGGWIHHIDTEFYSIVILLVESRSSSGNSSFCGMGSSEAGDSLPPRPRKCQTTHPLEFEYQESVLQK
ncbi:hypothetical protein BJX70DRAFT_241317 [Aspergillus crustosus]